MADGWASFGATPYTPADATTDVTTVQTVAQRPLVATIEAVLTAGQMVATLQPAPSGSAYMVRRITVSVPTPTSYSGRAYVYVGQAVPEALVMGTRSGALDIALEDPPLYIPETTPMTVTWDAGATRALARVEYDLA